MKKMIALGMAAIMCLSMTACSVSTSYKNETTAAATEAAETTAEAASTKGASDEAVLHIGSLKGPTTMGLVSLMDKASKGESEGSYDFTMVTDASELAAQMVSGDLDIALVPANLASILYQKTKQGVEVIDINTLGVLYVAAADDSIQSIADLKGKTLYMTGKGTTPDYVLQYLLSANGMTSDDLTIEYKSEAAEVAAVLKEQTDAIGLLPQPFVTVAMAQNENLKMVLNLTEEWEKLGVDSSMVTGVAVIRKDVADANPGAVKNFLEEYKSSVDWVNANAADAAALIENYDIVKAAVAEKAIPACHIVCTTGKDMKSELSGYLSVLAEQNPAAVGGRLTGR